MIFQPDAATNGDLVDQWVAKSSVANEDEIRSKTKLKSVSSRDSTNRKHGLGYKANTHSETSLAAKKGSSKDTFNETVVKQINKKNKQKERDSKVKNVANSGNKQKVSSLVEESGSDEEDDLHGIIEEQSLSRSNLGRKTTTSKGNGVGKVKNRNENSDTRTSVSNSVSNSASNSKNVQNKRKCTTKADEYLGWTVDGKVSESHSEIHQNTESGGGRKRKRKKTRSKQKNIRKDTRSDENKPEALQFGSKSYAGRELTEVSLTVKYLL